MIKLVQGDLNNDQPHILFKLFQQHETIIDSKSHKYIVVNK